LKVFNNYLKYLRNSNLIKEEVTVLLSWIFLQTLLVIPRGTRTNEVAACIVFVSVSKNMRVHLKRDCNDGHF